MGKKRLIAALILTACVFQGGCALVTLPVKIAGSALRVLGNVAGKAFALARKLPKPPPGAF